jgi:RNA polymerase sigma-70 factor (ECF subfamily)
MRPWKWSSGSRFIEENRLELAPMANDEQPIAMHSTGTPSTTGLTTLADSELVSRCCGGDRTAWRALYDRYSSSVFRFIGALGVPPDEREDAAQDVFMAVYRSLESFRGEAQLSTWIYRIAARHAGRMGRRRRVRELLGTLLLREPPPAPSPDPAERAARLLMIDKLLARLSPKKRMVLVLFEIEGLPVNEIAKVVDCPENTVWSRLHHARTEMLRMAKKADRAGKLIAYDADAPVRGSEDSAPESEPS